MSTSTIRERFDSVASSAATAFSLVYETAMDPSMVPLATAATVGLTTRFALKRLAATSQAAPTTAKEVRHHDQEALVALNALKLFQKPATTSGVFSGREVTFTKEEAAQLTTLNSLLSVASGVDTTTLERIFKPLVDGLKKSGADTASSINITPFADADVQTLADLYAQLYQSYLPTGSNVAASLSQSAAFDMIKSHLETSIKTRQKSEVSKWTTLKNYAEPIASSAATRLTSWGNNAKSVASSALAKSATAASAASTWASSTSTKVVPYLPNRTTVISFTAAGFTYAATVYAMRDDES